MFFSWPLIVFISPFPFSIVIYLYPFLHSVMTSYMALHLEKLMEYLGSISVSFNYDYKINGDIMN